MLNTFPAKTGCKVHKVIDRHHLMFCISKVIDTGVKIISEEGHVSLVVRIQVSLCQQSALFFLNPEKRVVI